ncbi:hypothetical protein CPCC7001_2669 [Cyanobium sp. PCC 7001]|nr:hypothetical protein CPCC7001_2669 [Cyanobium sp. PCC 7001]
MFAAAQDLARQRGQLGEGVGASLDQSSLSQTSFALKTKEGKLIARIRLPEVRRMLRFRQRLASQSVARAQGGPEAQLTMMDMRMRLRLRSDEERAVVWAISYGRRFPYVGAWWRHVLIGAALLLLGVVPGVIYFIWLGGRYSTYRKDLSDLVTRWRSLGKQDPDPSFFRLYKLNN